MCSYLYYAWAILALNSHVMKVKRWASFERGLKYMSPELTDF